MRLTSKALIGLLGSFFAVAPAMAEAGWTVNQIARGGAALNGGMTLYITPTGMRTYDAKNGVSLMTHAPQWNIYIYNTKTKRMFSSQLQPWLSSFRTRNLVGRFEGAQWRRGNQGVVAKVRAYEFVMDKPPPAKTNSKMLNGKIRSVGQMQSANLWVASDIVTPHQVSDILCKIYGIPDSQRIPLRLTVVENNRPSTLVDTSSCVQQNIPDSMFSVPGGMTPVKQDSDVFIDQESMDTLDEMLQDLDSPSSRRRPGAHR